MYKIIEGSPQDVTNIVTMHLKEGWVSNGLTTIVQFGDRVVAFQPLIKVTDD